MGQLTVRVNRLSFSENAIAAAQMLPRHKRELEKSLAQICRDNFPNLQAQGGSFQVRLNAYGKPVFYVNGSETSLPYSPAIKKVGRLFRFYQNIGSLPRQPAVQEAAREEASKKMIRKVSGGKVPGTNANLWAGARVADDSLSIYRKILAYRFGTDDPFASQLGYYAGSLWSLLFVKEILDGKKEFLRARALEDGEGKRRAETKIISGAILTGASLLYLGGKIVEEVLSKSTGAYVLSGSNLGFGIGALFGAAASSIGAYRCGKFGSRLAEYLDNPDLTEEQRLRGALLFLKDSLVVSVEEKAEIEESVATLTDGEKEKLIRQNLRDEVDHLYPALSGKDKKELIEHFFTKLTEEDKKARVIEEKIKQLTEVKVKKMKARTSNKSLNLILEKADSILKKLDSNRSEGVKEAKELMKVVRRDNLTKMLLYLIGAITSIVSFLGIIFLTLTPASMIPMFLMGVSSAISFTLWLYYYGPSLPLIPGKVYRWVKGLPDRLSDWAAERLSSTMRAQQLFLEKQMLAS